MAETSQAVRDVDRETALETRALHGLYKLK